MKHGNIIKYAGFLGLTALVLIFSGCFLSAPTGELVSPTIRAIGLPDISSVGTVTLKVTGPDMDPVEVSYSQLPSVINIAVPEGNDRKFELTVTMGSSYTGTVASYKGTATADITSDSAVVTLDMGIGGTKIVVPDTYNNRLVQIDDMSGTGWTTLKGSQLSTLGSLDANFLPVDVDFDQYGNFYVANGSNESYGIYNGIYRFTSIADSVPLEVLVVSNPGVDDPMKSVAIDRKNNRVYGLYWQDIQSKYVVYYNDFSGSLGTGGIGVQFSFSSTYLDMSYGVNGIYVDEDGNVYIYGKGSNSETVIEKYTSEGGSPIATYSTGQFGPVMGVTILKGVLYASVIYVTNPVQIRALDPATLAPVSGLVPLGQYSASPTVVGDFFGPHFFLAKMNNTLTFMDFDDYNVIGSRLVSFDNINGDNWKTYGSIGIGDGNFSFIQQLQ